MFNRGAGFCLFPELPEDYRQLTREEELMNEFDPDDIMGENYPSETFRVLKNNELRNFGEYRTQRLVLEAWDKLENEYGRR